MLAMLAAVDAKWDLMFLWLVIAFAVDGIDGPLARRYHVKKNAPEFDGVLMDLGVSSPQLDDAERGFSFMNDGPLDMRMDTTQGETAATVLGRLSEDELADLIYRFGGERLSRRVARSIKRMERQGNLDSTADLAVAVGAMNRAVEELVRECPEQYQWGYRRFKRRPEGEVPFYPE